VSQRIALQPSSLSLMGSLKKHRRQVPAVVLHSAGGG
jgi:hypothetical protein